MMEDLIHIVHIEVIEQVTAFLLADVSRSLYFGLEGERRSYVDAELWPCCFLVLKG